MVAADKVLTVASVRLHQVVQDRTGVGKIAERSITCDICKSVERGGPIVAEDFIGEAVDDLRRFRKNQERDIEANPFRARWKSYRTPHESQNVLPNPPQIF
jgi:hypothetical protein